MRMFHKNLMSFLHLGVLIINALLMQERAFHIKAGKYG